MIESGLECNEELPLFALGSVECNDSHGQLPLDVPFKSRRCKCKDFSA